MKEVQEEKNQKMDEVREENGRLRLIISQVEKEYQVLKMRLNGAVHNHNKSSNCSLPPTAWDAGKDSDDNPGLVSLSLGKSVFSDDFNGEERAKKANKKKKKKNTDVYDRGNPDGLELRLQCRSHSDAASTDEVKEEGGSNNEMRGTTKNPRNRDDNQQILQQNPNWKRPRVSVQRCTAMLNCSSSTTSAMATPAATSSSLNQLLRLNQSSSMNNSSLVTSQLPKISFSSLQSHPTVVLDLTTPNHYSNLNKFSMLDSPQTSLDFSYSDSCSRPNRGWRMAYSSMRGLHSQQPSDFCRGFWDSQKQAANDQKMDISAGTTKAVMGDPSFQTALAAAITSYVGSKAEGRKPELDYQLSFSQPLGSIAGIGCTTSSFLDK